MLMRYTFGLKVVGIVLTTFAFAFVVTLPARNYIHKAEDPSNQYSYLKFSGTETNPDQGYKYAWATPGAYLLDTYVPRYSPLNLRIKLDLRRPEGVSPTRIEIYENTVIPVGEPRLVTTLEYKPDDPNSNTPHDFYVTIPTRENGKGLVLELRSNYFQVQGDPRQLGFIYLEAELDLPQNHAFWLFWPNPYWPAMFVLLTVMTAWSLRSGLNMLETLLLVGLAGGVLVTVSAATYQNSWWMLMVAVALWPLYWWDGRRLARGKRWSLWPLLGATSLILIFFLFDQDQYSSDIGYYFGWSNTIHDEGIWNVYNNNASLNYPPLIVYLLWLRNFIVYPLGLESNYIAWRITVSLLYLAVVAVIYLTNREATNQPDCNSKETAHPGQWLAVVAFNAGLFYNPTMWGQSDMIAVLPLVGTFYLLYRRQALSGGLLVGLVLISKPQAWFILPLLIWMLVQRCSWKRGGLGLILGGTVALIMAGVAYGFDLNAVIRYLTNSEFGGDYRNDTPVAFNLSYLVLGSEKTDLPTWLTGFGFGMVGLTILIVLYFSRGRNRSIQHYGLAATLLGLGCFSWLIKMKERYLIFGLTFLGLAALRQRRFILPFLALSWLQLLHLIAAMYWQKPWKESSLLDYPYWWSQRLNEVWVRQVLSVGTLALFFYLFALYLIPLRPNQSKIKAEKQELVTH